MKKITWILFIALTQLFANEIKEIKSDEILKAMLTQQGYKITATTNVARFQGSVLLQIAKNSLAEDSTSKLLYINGLNWYEAYQKLTGYNDIKMPMYSHLSVKCRQNQLLDLRENKIFSKNKKLPTPNLAMNVIVGWKKEDYNADFYTFNDTLSNPVLKVINSRQITYRILEFDDMIYYGEMQGVAGQPTSGLLGLIFDVIGEGKMMWSRFAITSDGIQINRAKAKKGLFEIESTLTIYPNGVTEKNIPKDATELKFYERLLKKPLKYEFVPLEDKMIEFICGD